MKKYRKNVGIVVINNKNLVFCAKRIDLEDAWQMPQGGVDDGEDFLKAALRELEEETSIVSVEYITQIQDYVYYDFPPESKARLWKGNYVGQKQKWFLFKFIGEDKEINLKTKEPEFSEWKWTEKKEVVDKIACFKKDVYKKVFQKFSDYVV